MHANSAIAGAPIMHHHQRAQQQAQQQAQQAQHAQQANGPNPFQALLNDQESQALISFLDKVSADPNFLFDPKITDGLFNMGYSDLPATPQETPNTHPQLVFASDPKFAPRQARRASQTYHSTGPAPSSAKNPQKVVKTDRRPSAARREGLTEDQKRMNHISSEKRRRDLIKRQFEKMCSMVPKLASSDGSISKSKSAILLTVYEYLVFLVEQNQMIRNILYSHGISADDIPDSSKRRS